VSRDTVWSGEVRVDGIVHVRRGATLTILPGTRVAFSARRARPQDEHEGFSGSGIRVEGRIVAAGTAERPIAFTSAGGAPSPGSWDRIFFSFSAGNRFEHCVVEGARYAFHAHFAEIDVSRCLFRDNEEGVRLGASRGAIRDSVFTRNLVRGINFREGRHEIRGNLVSGNGDGIFLHSKAGASVIRGNAICANRGYDLRLGDLHEEDVDVSGNWWGTPREEEALRRVYDGRRLAGIGRARLAPLLARPPVAGARIAGVVTSHMVPVEGAEVFAWTSLERGFVPEAAAASARTAEGGVFCLEVPPGRYYVAARAETAAGRLFAFPGRNPVAVDYGERVELGLPAAAAPPRPAAVPAPGGRTAALVLVTRDGAPVEGAAVQAFAADAFDFRGRGGSQAVTGVDGRAVLYLAPGAYHIVAKRRTGGAAAGMVDEGGLFGVFPYGPLVLAPGSAAQVEIPVFEKRGYLEGEETGGLPAGRCEGLVVRGFAALGGRPAGGHVVHFYRAPETVGRPAGRSGLAAADGGFEACLPGPGDYLAFLRRADPARPGEIEEGRFGPVAVRAGQDGSLGPRTLSFPAP